MSRLNAIVCTRHKVYFQYQGTQYCFEKRNKRKLKAMLKNKLKMREFEVNELLDTIVQQEAQMK